MDVCILHKDKRIGLSLLCIALQNNDKNSKYNNYKKIYQLFFINSICTSKFSINSSLFFLVVTIDITANLNYILLVTEKVTTCTQKKFQR